MNSNIFKSCSSVSLECFRKVIYVSPSLGSRAEQQPLGQFPHHHSRRYIKTVILPVNLSHKAQALAYGTQGPQQLVLSTSSDLAPTTPGCYLDTRLLFHSTAHRNPHLKCLHLPLHSPSLSPRYYFKDNLRGACLKALELGGSSALCFHITPGVPPTGHFTPYKN